MGMETSLYGVDLEFRYSKLPRAVLDFDDSYEIHIPQFQPDGINRYYNSLLPCLDSIFLDRFFVVAITHKDI